MNSPDWNVANWSFELWDIKEWDFKKWNVKDWNIEDWLCKKTSWYPILDNEEAHDANNEDAHYENKEASEEENDDEEYEEAHAEALTIFDNMIEKAQTSLKQGYEDINADINAVIHGVPCKCKFVESKEDKSYSSIYVIDKFGKGFLFTCAGENWENNFCFKIKNNKIIDSTCYNIQTDERYQNPVFDLCMAFEEQANKQKQKVELDDSEPGDSGYKSKIVGCITKLVDAYSHKKHKIEQGEYNVIIQTYPETERCETNEERSKVGFATNKDVKITNQFGHGKIFYSNGHTKSIIKNKIIDDSDEYVDKDFVDKIKKELRSVDFNTAINRMGVYLRHPKITDKPKSEFKIFDLINGYTVSVRKPVSGIKKKSLNLTDKDGKGRGVSSEPQQSIKIIDQNGNGRCYFEDGYCNPVINKHNTIEGSRDKGKIYFQTLQTLIQEERYEALTNLCEKLLHSNMEEKVDLKLYESSNGGKKYNSVKELNEYLLNNNPHFHSKNKQKVPNGSHKVKKTALEAGIFKNRADLAKLLSKAKKKPIFAKNWQSLATDGKKKKPSGV